MNASLTTALFYTMSTISQTISGAMGLLGAIVLFALQETTRSTERAAKKLTEVQHETLSPLYLRHLLTRRSFHEIARLYGQVLQPGASHETSADALVHYATLVWELEHDQALRRSFWTALLASGIVVSFSLICCGLTPQLSANLRIGDVVLGAGLLGAVSCLILYGFLLRVMLRSSPREPMVPHEATDK